MLNFLSLKTLYIHIMSNDEDKGTTETSNSKEPATLPSKAPTEEDG